MNSYIQNTKTYVTAHKKYFILGTEIAFGTIVAITISLFIYNSSPKVTYPATKACDLLSSVEAKELLGNRTTPSSSHAPVISDNTASSDCGYTDGNPDTNSMVVAALIVRSGINDKGVQQNKTEFIAGKPTTDVETIKNIGDSAYFNHTLGQLNILSGRRWIILSYGVGSTPTSNTLDDALKLAIKVLH